MGIKKGREGKSEGGRERIGQAIQRSMTPTLAHYTRTVVIKAQGSSKSYFFLNKVVQNNTFYSLYKNNSSAVK